MIGHQFSVIQQSLALDYFQWFSTFSSLFSTTCFTSNIFKLLNCFICKILFQNFRFRNNQPSEPLINDPEYEEDRPNSDSELSN